MNAIGDPRSFALADGAGAFAREIHALARESLSAATGDAARARDAELRERLLRHVAEGGGTADLVTNAPSVDVARHVWRQLDAVAAEADDPGAGVVACIFAIPVVIVAGTERGSADVLLPGTLSDAGRCTDILRDHDALHGNRSFALADVLVQADALDVARLPDILAWQRLRDDAGADPAAGLRALAPAAIRISAGREGVHLRLLAGTALARPGADLFGDAQVGPWGMPLAREIGRALGAGGASVLALPRAPQRPLRAVAAGRAAQREVSAQIFAGNALRRLRGAVGEPVAVISAHHAPDAPGGGELRLSLSSVFESRDAEGFRCPLGPFDRVVDVVAMLTDLLRDCRVADVRVLPGVYPDRDAATGLPLLFKPATIPDGVAPLH